MATYIDGKLMTTSQEVKIQDKVYLSNATISANSQTDYIFLEHNESLIIFTIICDNNPHNIHPIGSWTGVSGIAGDFFLPMDNGLTGNPLAQVFHSVNYGVQNPTTYPAGGVYYSTYIFKNPPPYIKFFNNDSSDLVGYSSSYKTFL